MQPWNGSGRLWTALTGSKEVWTVLEGSGRLWEASNSSRKLARSLRDVRNDAPTDGGKSEAHFAKSMFFIAEACSLANIAKSRRNHW